MFLTLQQKQRGKKIIMDFCWRKCVSTFRVAKDKIAHQFHQERSTHTKREQEENKLWAKMTSLIQTEPTLVCPGLYLGNAMQAADWPLLESLRVRCIVNVTQEIGDYFKDNSTIQYIRIPLLDDDKAELKTHLEPAFQTLTEQLAKARVEGTSVLVHCYLGSSRSASIVAYYLMRTNGLSAVEATEHLRALRPIVNLNERFMKDLAGQEQ